jgi:hypothetical protein
MKHQQKHIDMSNIGNNLRNMCQTPDTPSIRGVGVIELLSTEQLKQLYFKKSKSNWILIQNTTNIIELITT